ncbi:hypothetical protein F2Q69_00017818 [Brassica cretica]|uniref:DNA repair nuclease/redox regulator APEX1 n=1 Tax=Brassica cretica TaxID=69181 RepID=A0A8S9R7V4_BRACR|nr:hypothetical protein F2Q69_00017818 [Brassica cretica]
MSFSNNSSITRESSSSHATVRKVLEFDDTDDLVGESKVDSAVPPQSPPSCPLIDEQGSSVRSPELRRPSRQVRILHLLVQSLGLSVLLPSDSLLTLRQTKPITSLMSDLFWVLFLVVVPFRSLRFASSIVGVRVGTSSFNKRLMSNATAKSVPLSINNIKGKPMKGNKRSAGFTIEERQSFGENFLEKGFVDTFRKQHPGVVGYTYWGYRSGARKTNRGWRLDYFLVSESIAANVHDSYILPDVNGSDHCPIGLILKL